MRKTRMHFRLAVHAKRMREKWNHFQSTVCMMARGVIYAPPAARPFAHVAMDFQDKCLGG
jgi:hypothetical protein